MAKRKGSCIGLIRAWRHVNFGAYMYNMAGEKVYQSLFSSKKDAYMITCYRQCDKSRWYYKGVKKIALGLCTSRCLTGWSMYLQVSYLWDKDTERRFQYPPQPSQIQSIDIFIGRTRRRYVGFRSILAAVAYISYRYQCCTYRMLTPRKIVDVVLFGMDLDHIEQMAVRKHLVFCRLSYIQ